MGLFVFILRLFIGGFFLLAGALKVAHPAALAVTIAAMQVVPRVVIAPLAMLLPYFEIGLGVYLIIGLFTRAAAIIVMMQLIVFAGIIASVVARGIVTSCGCFGPADTAPATYLDVVRDLVLALAVLPVVLAGPGRFAVDSHMRDTRE